MIFAISDSPLPDFFPFAYEWKTGIWVNSITESFEFQGYCLPDGQGNWTSIIMDEMSITVESSIINDFRKGTNENLGIVLTNHARLIDKFFNNNAVRFTIDSNKQITIKHFDIKQLFSKKPKILFSECVDRVKQRLIKNVQVLVEQYRAKYVAYTGGLDSTVNALIGTQFDPTVCVLIDQKHSKKIKHRFDRYQVVAAREYQDELSPYSIKENLKYHFYDFDRVIAGFAGDTVALHSSDLFFQSEHLVDHGLRYSDLYDTHNSHYDKFVSIAQLKSAAWNQAVTPKFQLWVSENYQILDPYRDIHILLTVLSMTDSDIVRQCGNAKLQKKIIEQLDDNYLHFINKNKNVY